MINRARDDTRHTDMVSQTGGRVALLDVALVVQFELPGTCYSVMVNGV